MPEATFFLRPLTAVEALEKCRQIPKAIFGKRRVKLNLTTSIHGLSLTVNLEDGNVDVDTRDEVRVFSQTLTQSKLPIACVMFEVSDVTNQPHGGSFPRIQYGVSDSLTGQIVLEGMGSPARIIEVSNFVGDIFALRSRSEILFENLPEPQKNALKYHEGIVADLRAETSKIAAFNLEQLRKQDEFFKSLAVVQDERYRQREELLEQKHRALEEKLGQRETELEEQHRARETELDKREEEHNRKVAEHDARENMIVRRELLRDILKVIDTQKTFNLSTDTGKKRSLVHYLCVGALGVTTLLVSAFAYRLSVESTPQWYHLAPLSASVLFFVSTLVYYIKWNDSWFRDHALAELRNKKLHADILRASWLAELFFEVKDKERQLPESLVNRFSEGLFLESSTAAPEHVADQMVELVRKLSSVEVSKDGVKVSKSAAKEG